MRKALSAGAVLGVAVAIGAESGPLRVGTEAQAERASANGVQIAIDRRAGTTVRVGSATRRVVRRGGMVTVTCGLPGDSFPTVEIDSFTVPWPRGATSIRVPELKRGYDFCSVHTRDAGTGTLRQMADVAFNAAGRSMLVEREAADWVFANLQKLQITGRESRGGRYPTADELRHANYTPLATPDELPPPDAIGVYSSEAERRLRVVKLSASGAPVYVELVQGEFRSNVPQWMAWFFGR
jgi:hypothetical protein